MNNIIERFLQNIISEQTKLAYKTDIKEFLQFTKCKIKTISYEDLLNYRDKITKVGLAPASINRKLSSIRSLLSWCVCVGHIKENPALRVKLPKPETIHPTLAFTDVEVIQMLSAPKKTPRGKTHKLILTFLFRLGLRRSELVNIKVEDIYEDRGVPILQIKGKGQKIRSLPLNPDLNYKVNKYITKHNLQSDDYLFQFRAKRRINPNTINRIVIRYAKSIGIGRKMSAHSCRATVISHLLERGVSPRDVADFAGHASINTTVGIYDKKRDNLTNSASYKVDFNT